MSIKSNYLNPKWWISNAGMNRKPSDVVRLFANDVVASLADSATYVSRLIIDIPHECFPTHGGSNPKGAIVSRVGLYLTKTDALKGVDWSSGVTLAGASFFHDLTLISDTLTSAGANKGDIGASARTLIASIASTISIGDVIASSEDNYVYWELPYESDSGAYTTNQLATYGPIIPEISISNACGSAIGFVLTPWIEIQKLRV